MDALGASLEQTSGFGGACLSTTQSALLLSLLPAWAAGRQGGCSRVLDRPAAHLCTYVTCGQR
jgi:hypothetical protein